MSKLRLRLCSLLLACCLAFGLTGCGVDITSVGLPASMQLEKGETTQLTVDFGAQDGATEEAIAKAAEKLTLVWSSSDEAVATVDETGKVTAVGAGTADITVALEEGNISSTCEVKVVVPAEGVTAPETLNLEVNGENTAQLDVKATPEDATDVTFTYESSKPEVATVDENGVVTAVANGEADITVTMTQKLETDTAAASAGENAVVMTATTHVVVTTKVESLTFEKGEGSLTIGNSTTMKVTVLPESASDQTITWKSSDESVATVDEDGKVKAVKVGTATITASAGDVKAEYALTVRDVTCSYCGKTGHTSSSCPTKAADEQAAAQQAAQSGGGSTTPPSAPSNPDPAPAPNPGGGSGSGSSGGGGGTGIGSDWGNQVVTGDGAGDGSGEVPPL